MKRYIVLFFIIITHCVECFSQTNCILDSTLTDQVKVHWSSSYDKLFQNHLDSMRTTALRRCDIELINKIIAKRKVKFRAFKAKEKNSCVFLNMQDFDDDNYGIAIGENYFEFASKNPYKCETYNIPKNMRDEVKEMLAYYHKEAEDNHLTTYYHKPMISVSRYTVPHFYKTGFAIIDFYVLGDSSTTHIRYHVDLYKKRLLVQRKVVLCDEYTIDIHDVDGNTAITYKLVDRYLKDNEVKKKKIWIPYRSFTNSDIRSQDIWIEQVFFPNWRKMTDEEKMKLLDQFIQE